MRKRAASRPGWVPVDIQRSSSYPGRILYRELAARGMSQMELARRMGGAVRLAGGNAPHSHGAVMEVRLPRL